MPRVLVVCHPRDWFDRGHYLMHAMAHCLRKWGIEVAVQRGWDDRPDADLVIPHVDLTVWPPGLIEFLAGYPNVVNRRVIDISKRRVSSNLVGPDDDWRGPVIVKSDANYGGVVDRRIADEDRQTAGIGASATASRPEPPGRLLPPHYGEYAVFGSIGAVPAAVWGDSSLVVERFLAERAGDLYVERQLFLFGDVHVMREVRGTHPVVKGETVVDRRWTDDAPPPRVLGMAREFGLEYGKIDFTLVGGEPIVFDIARTPTGRRWIKGSMDVVVRLARGIRPLLRRRSERDPMIEEIA